MSAAAGSGAGGGMGPAAVPLPDPASAATRRATMTAIALLRMLVFVLVSVMGVAASAIARDLDVASRPVFWLSTLYLVGLCAALPAAGRIGDRHGHRRVLLAGLGLFLGGNVLAAVAPGIDVLLLARFLQGLGAAAILPGLTAFFLWITPPRERGRGDGLLVGAMMVGIAAGPVIGAILVDGPGWRAVFWATALVAAIALVLLVRRGPDPARDPGLALPWRVIALWAAGITLVLCGISLGSASAMLDAQVLVPVGAGIVLLAGALVADRRAAAPLLHPRLRGLRIFLVAVCGIACYQWVLLAFNLAALRYLGVSVGMSPVAAALALLPALLPIAVVAPLTGRIVDRTGHRPPLLVGFAGTAFALGAIALLTAPPETPASPATGALILPFAAFGVAMGLLLVALETGAMGRVDRPLRGVAAALANVSRETAGALGAAVVAIGWLGSEERAIEEALAALPENRELMDAATLDAIARGIPSEMDRLAVMIPELDGMFDAIHRAGAHAAWLVALAIIAGGAVVGLLVTARWFPRGTRAAQGVESDLVVERR